MSTILVVALVVGVLCLSGARLAALAVGLIDRPDARKRHLGEVPLAGGLGLYVTLLVVSVATWPLAPVGADGIAAVALGGPALVLGMVDDARGLPPKARLGLQICIALLLTWLFGIRIVELGDVLGTGAIVFGSVLSILFTAFCVIGALNATNMTDGLDGLLGSLIAMSLAALVLMAIEAGRPPEPLCIITIGALTAFLAFNLCAFGFERRMFLGDSGSTLLGLLLAVLVIGASQGPRASIEPVTAGWLLGLPLLDTTVVVARRLLAGRSPLVAGRDHLHHLLQDLGLSPRLTLVAMVVLHGAMLGVGGASETSGIPSWAFLYGFVALALLHFATSALMASRIARRAGRLHGATDLAPVIPVSLPVDVLLPPLPEASRRPLPERAGSARPVGARPRRRPSDARAVPTE